MVIFNGHSILGKLGIVDYKEEKDEWLINCIFCTDGKYNLQINFNKGLYHCWVCNSGGTVLDFISKVLGIDNVAAQKVLGTREIDASHEIREIFRNIESGNNKKEYDWDKYKRNDRYYAWSNRDVSRKMVDRFYLGTNKEGDLVIPVFQRRRCVGLIVRSKKRNSRIKYKYTKGMEKNKLLFNEDILDAAKLDYLVIAEGPIDVIKLTQFGLKAVGVLGSYLSNYQLQQIKRATTKIIIAFDNEDMAKGREKEIVNQLNKYCDLYTLIYDTQDPGALTAKSQLRGMRRVLAL